MLAEHEQRQLRLGGLPEIQALTHDQQLQARLLCSKNNVSLQWLLEDKGEIARRPRPDRVLASSGFATQFDIIAKAGRAGTGLPARYAVKQRSADQLGGTKLC
jgi:hypothetical protein